MRRPIKRTGARIAALTMLAFATAFGAPSMRAQAAPAKAVAPKARTAAAARSVSAPVADKPDAGKKPGVEGMTVHGHWLIRVLDKSGKEVERRDFENALRTNSNIMAILSGQQILRDFAIILFGFNDIGIYPADWITCTAPSTLPCNLTTSISLSSSSITLSGSAVVSGSNQITQVGTEAITYVGHQYQAPDGSTQYIDYSPAEARSHQPSDLTDIKFQYNQFTAATIDTLNLTDGQTVLVTVTLSVS